TRLATISAAPYPTHDVRGSATDAEPEDGELLIVVVDGRTVMRASVRFAQREQACLEARAPCKRAIVTIARVGQSRERHLRRFCCECLERTFLDEHQQVVDGEVEAEVGIGDALRVSIDEGRWLFVPSAAERLRELLHRRHDEPLAARQIGYNLEG